MPLWGWARLGGPGPVQEVHQEGPAFDQFAQVKLGGVKGGKDAGGHQGQDQARAEVIGLRQLRSEKKPDPRAHHHPQEEEKGHVPVGGGLGLQEPVARLGHLLGQAPLVEAREVPDGL